jgi:transposase InsO family protein
VPGALRQDVAAGLRLRHDHGSQYVSHDFQAEIRFLGLESSPAFVREPEGNGCAERFIRTLKENLLWVRRFETVEELRLALQRFGQTYNETWIIERHGYRHRPRSAPLSSTGYPWPHERKSVSHDSGPVHSLCVST